MVCNLSPFVTNLDKIKSHFSSQANTLLLMSKDWKGFNSLLNEASLHRSYGSIRHISKPCCLELAMDIFVTVPKEFLEHSHHQLGSGDIQIEKVGGIGLVQVHVYFQGRHSGLQGDPIEEIIWFGKAKGV